MNTDYTRLRGVNYVPATTQSRDFVQAMLTPRGGFPHDPTFTARYPRNGTQPPFGQFDKGLILEELRVLRAIGFDSIRMSGSHLGWLIDRGDFLSNLRWLVERCAGLEMKLTYIIWSGIAQRSYALLEWLLGPPIHRRGIEDAIQAWSDSRHMHYHGLRPRAHVGLVGTYFEMGDWGEPDLAFATRPGGFASWNGYTRLDQIANLRVGRTLGDSVKSYLQDLAEVFHGRAGFLSYDLFNEPEAWILENNGSASIVLEVLGQTYDILKEKHAKLGGPMPDVTIGMAGDFGHTRTLYDAMRMSTPSRPMTYLSFHDYSPRLWDDAYYQDIGRLRGALGLPAVISEFYGPYANPNAAWGNPRGRLRDILGRMVRDGIGGQIWAIMQTNFFKSEPFQSPGLPPVEPLDGLLVPIDREFGFQWPDQNRVLWFDFTPPPWAGYFDDVRALADWT